jgi:hypothetical protein
MFCSCNNYHLAKDYYYLSDDESKDIGYPYGTIVYKSEHENSFVDPIVYSDIKKCVFDNKYILVYQEPNKVYFYKELEDKIKAFNSNFISTKKDTVLKLIYGSISTKVINALINKNDNQVKRVADSIITNEIYYKKMFTNKFNYWIIRLSDDSLIGPLNKEEYLGKRNELNISSSLKLEE